jgi:hypothetical protein
MAASLSTRLNCSSSSRRKGLRDLPWNRTQGPRPRLWDKLEQAQHLNHIAVAFAALGAELKDLLGLPIEKWSSTESHQHGPERQAAEFTERNAQFAAELAAVHAATAEKAIAEADKATTEYASLAEQLTTIAEARRPWWRRLVG